MARIRTIKPEFPQSESMGRVSRDARLLFIMLWTLCDDSGRTRGNSRMLASLLFPYDGDASGLIDGWLAELEREGCTVRYSSGGQTYLEVRNWLNHQKIDKPSQSKIPAFDESSRILANPRERSSEDQGMDQGMEGDQGTDSANAESPAHPSAELAYPCPHQAIVAAYHEALPMLPQVREWTAERQKLLRARWREKPERQTVQWWADFFAYVAESDFLTGRAGDFAADLEWLIRPKNFVKVYEGRYENRRRNESHPS